MIISGILLTFVPNIFEIIFNSKLYYDNWIRLFGALAFIIGLGYVAILLAPFNIYLILWTIIARYFFSIVSITFFLLNFFAAPILFVGIFDALNATWTLIGLYLILK
ncbi:MAG: hypothetical protein LBD05_01170 [Mycoplasmataceae bacterium]|nr:hypothetical protein [Mycoplasmataceae bacterium]